MMQLLRSPVGTLVAQSDHCLLDFPSDSVRAVLGSPGALLDARQALLFVPFAPHIPGLATDPIPFTQVSQRLLLQARFDDKLTSLIGHTCRIPRHPQLSKMSWKNVSRMS